MARIFVDRPREEGISAIAATWVLFCVAFVAESEEVHVLNLVAGGLLGAVLVVPGFLAASRVRPLPSRPVAQRAWLAVLALCAGGAVGGVILVQLLAIATFDPRTAAGVVRPVSQPLFELLMLAYSAAVVEEVAVRLFGMSVIAWIVVNRYGKEPDVAFHTALVGSALLFGLAHLPGISPGGLTLVLFNVLAGLLLGWIFWRWGLPYAILCHFLGGLIIQSMGPILLA